MERMDIIKAEHTFLRDFAENIFDLQCVFILALSRFLKS